MKYAVFGNCQAGPISAMLDHLLPHWEKVSLIAVHLVNEANAQKILDAILSVDVLIHQPISKEFGEFATEKLKARYPHIRFISFPNIYFSGYFNSLIYLRKPEGGTLSGVVGDYHDSRVVEGFLNRASTGRIMKQMRASSEAPLEPSLSSLATLKEKELLLDIKISGFIENNYLVKQLFYVFNHPTNELLLIVARKVCELLEEQPTNKTFPKEYLSNFTFPVDSKLRTELINNNNFHSNYSMVNQENELVSLSMEEFVENSIELYSKVDNLRELYDYSKNRRKIIGF